MKFVFPATWMPMFGFGTLALILAGCGHRSTPEVLTADERLHRTLAGTWTNEAGLLVLESDGSYWEQWSTRTSPTRIWASEGLWSATNDVLVFTCTNSRSWGTTNRVRKGTESARIVSIG